MTGILVLGHKVCNLFVARCLYITMLDLFEGRLVDFKEMVRDSNGEQESKKPTGNDWWRCYIIATSLKKLNELSTEVRIIIQLIKSKETSSVQ